MRALSILFLLAPLFSAAQLRWTRVDSAFGPLPPSVGVYFTNMSPDTGTFRAYYLVADLTDRRLTFTADTTRGRRLTPTEFYQRDGQPVVVVNTTFFSFDNNANLNLVMKGGKLLAYNRQSFPGRGRDTLTYRHVFPATIGIDKKRRARVMWTYADTGMRRPYAALAIPAVRDSIPEWTLKEAKEKTSIINPEFGGVHPSLRKWKVRTAVGGGPALLYQGRIHITNNEELRFPGKAISDKHPRTAMGITPEGKLIILMVEGRNPEASGASLTQLAEILRDLGCVEGLNLDGGGSSCMLINGKETIRPSDKKQRSVPAVFEIHWKER